MCDALLGGSIFSTLALAQGITSDVLQRQTAARNQEVLNDAIETKYNADIENARKSLGAQQFQAQEKANQETLKSKQEERQASLQALQENAHSEAAMSALNISGNTAQRQLKANETGMDELENAYDYQEEAIHGQYLADTKGAQTQYDNNIRSAKASADAAWRPFDANPWWVSALNIGSSAANAFMSGANAGKTFGDAWNSNAGDGLSSGIGGTGVNGLNTDAFM